MKHNIIRFDWAIKRLLRQKANFVVLEGFLSELLKEDIKIDSLLESESNQKDENDKFNRVDLLARNSRGELIIVEVQNTRELHYFQRMLYGVSKAITEYIYLGERYNHVKKLYSVNIVYFDLGQGMDYIYHGYTDFTGVHTKDTLLLSRKQQELFIGDKAGDLFPEYYVLRLNEFNDKAVTPIDEWIDYLKNGEISEKTTAKGLQEALQLLKMDEMDSTERACYIRHMENLAIQWDVLTTAHIEGWDEGMEEGLEKGLQEGIEKTEAKKREIAQKLKIAGVQVQIIVLSTGLSEEEVNKL